MTGTSTAVVPHRAGYCPRCRPRIRPLPRPRPAVASSGWIPADQWIRAVEAAQDREVTV
jgi:hypothetical protein